MSLNDAAILVTGASRGLGRALAEQLAARGARVVLVARHPEPLDDVVGAIRANGGAAFAITADVADPRAARAIAQQAADVVGDLDVLVHNASTLGPVPLPLLLDLSPEAFEDVLRTNLIGPFRLTRALVGPMALAGRGLVLSISSDAAVEAYPRWGAYGASKAALDHLTRTLAAELGPTGVTFAAVDPGEMDTAMHAAAIPDADPATLADPRAVARWIAERVATGAFRNGERVAVSRDAVRS